MTVEERYAERAALSFEEVDRMVSHWWWRPGHRAGRSTYTYHVIFDDAPEVAQLAARYQEQLASPSLDAVPPEGLHLTTQGVGFTDEVSPNDLRAIIGAVRSRVAALAPFEVTLGGLDAHPEALMLHLTPWGPMDQLRKAVRAGVGEVWGEDRVPETDRFVPHVTVAYGNSEVAAEPVRRRLRNLDHHWVKTTIRAISLLDFNRDEDVYRWRTVDKAMLGTD